MLLQPVPGGELTQSSGRKQRLQPGLWACKGKGLQQPGRLRRRRPAVSCRSDTEGLVRPMPAIAG